jgi:hypothetical protein
MASEEARKRAPELARGWLRMNGRRAAGTVKVIRQWCPGRARVSRWSSHTRLLGGWHCGQCRFPQEQKLRCTSPHWLHA